MVYSSPSGKIVETRSSFVLFRSSSGKKLDASGESPIFAKNVT